MYELSQHMCAWLSISVRFLLFFYFLVLRLCRGYCSNSVLLFGRKQFFSFTTSTHLIALKIHRCSNQNEIDLLVAARACRDRETIVTSRTWIRFWQNFIPRVYYIIIYMVYPYINEYYIDTTCIYIYILCKATATACY